MSTDGPANPPEDQALADAAPEWTPDGAPRSRRFDDVYFSKDGGLAETRAVFLEGCGLPDAWRGRHRFVVAETGFGTGLNVLALLQLWRAHRPAGAHLHIFSCEAYPLTRSEAARALTAWPELADLARILIDHWPRRAPGYHRVDWSELGATLDLAVGDVLCALKDWDGRADAWFLDGFAPAKNPLMWRPEVLAAVAEKSSPGAALATFTVAGGVRRGLEAAGFVVEKRPGHGAKRQRLQARRSGLAPLARLAPRVAIIGAGIAGAALARAFRAQGLTPIVVGDPNPSPPAASGNPSALVTPALDAGGGARARFYAQAFARAVDLYRALGCAAVIGEGVEQLARDERDRRRFGAVLASGLFEPDAIRRTAEGLMIVEGLWLRPAAIVGAWLEGCPRIPARVDALERRDEAWTLLAADGRIIDHVDVVCLAGGSDPRLNLGFDLAFDPIRGQVSWASGLTLDHARAWGGYAIPMDGGLLFGATHDRGQREANVSAEDHGRNLAVLAQALPDLAAQAARLVLSGRAAVRATTLDRLPAAGPIGPPGLYILGGLGSRGFTTAPLLAEHVVARALSAPSPLPLSLQPLADPARLAKRSGRPTAC